MSRSTNTSDLDWAVVYLEGADIFSRIKLATKFPSFQNVICALRGTKTVQVFTESDAATDRKITGTPTFIQVPHSIAFQEMWTVQLDGPLREWTSVIFMLYVIISNCESQNVVTADPG
jgi:hypothetical protein